MMSLRHAAWAALAGLTCIFVFRTVDTFRHGIFAQPALAASVVVLNILAGLAQLNFYIQLFRKMAPPDMQALRLAGWMGIAGSALGILPKLLPLAVLYQRPVFFPFLKHGSKTAAFAPWSAAVLLFLCCLIFHREYRSGPEPSLRKAFAAGAFGYFAMTMVLSVVLFHYLSGVRIDWSTGRTGTGPLLYLSTAAIIYLALARFYAGFIRRF